MIYEVELSNLSYPDAPKKKTEVPGPNVQKLLDESAKYEPLSLGADAFLLIMEESHGLMIGIELYGEIGVVN